MKRFLSNIFLIYTFFFVQVLQSNISEQHIVFFQIHILLIYLGLALFNLKSLFIRDNSKPVFFASILFIFGVFIMLLKDYFSILAILIPIGTLFGYFHYKKISINIKAFDLFFIVLYSYYYVTYYSLLPDLFFRPGFNEEIYLRSSSNVISYGLNLYLLLYIVVLKDKSIIIPKRLLVYSTINIVLIVIQQSRAGLIVGLIIFSIVLFSYLKENSIVIKKWHLTLFFIVLFYMVLTVGVKYYKILFGEVSFTLSDDIRSNAQLTFLKNLDSFKFFFGYPKDYIFTLHSQRDLDLSYTYNIALDVWNKYSIFALLALIYFFLNRILKHRFYKIPLYFLVPIIIYGSVESIFLPAYWDILLYILLFSKSQKKEMI